MMWILIALTVFINGHVTAEALREFDTKDAKEKCSVALMALDSGKSPATHSKTWYVCLPQRNDALGLAPAIGSEQPSDEGATK